MVFTRGFAPRLHRSRSRSPHAAAAWWCAGGRVYGTVWGCKVGVGGEREHTEAARRPAQAQRPARIALTPYFI